MNQSQVARILKIATAAAAVVAAGVFLFYLPLAGWQLAEEVAEEWELTWLYVPALVVTEAVWVLVNLALRQFWKVCRRIGENASFSQENARSFRLISRFALIGTALVAVPFVGLCVLGLMNAAFGIPFLLVIFVGLGVAVLSWCLSLLIANAAELKQQADLTI